jgi:site-specific DNA-cytosine methylase
LCQPFSIGGKQEGFKDTQKANLFYSILRIVDCMLNLVLILENVSLAIEKKKSNTSICSVAQVLSIRRSIVAFASDLIACASSFRRLVHKPLSCVFVVTNGPVHAR